MVRIFLYLILIAVVITAAVRLADAPGHVTLVWQGWRVDTSVAVLIVGIIALSVAIYAILRSWSGLRRMAQDFSARRAAKRLDEGLTALGDTLAALHSSEAGAAAKHLKIARRHLGRHGTLEVIDAQIARLSGDTSREAKLAAALLDRKETRLSGLKELATIAMEAGEVDKALAYVSDALSRKPRPAWAVRMQASLMLRAQDWTGALAAVSGHNAKGVFTEAEVADLRADILLARGRTELDNGQPDLAVKSATLALEAHPESDDAAALLITALGAANKGRKAEKTFMQLWTRAPSSALMDATTALLPGDDALASAGALERLMAGAPAHPLTRLARARACADAGLWGQVEDLAQKLVDDADAEPKFRAQGCRLMARRALQDSKSEKIALKWLDKAVELMAEV